MLSLNKYLNRYILLIVVCICLFKNNIGQNLIQNGSFESYTVSAFGCAYNFSMVNIWQQINSPDHFTSLCTLSNYGVPNNNFGVSYPKNGNAYIGLGLLNLPYETKEYIYQHLVTPLIAGKSYYTSFFLSKSDKSRIAIEKIGAWFSISPPVAPSNTYVNAIPQIENHSGFLTDTVNWVKIEGYFKAQGGEEYITIGNFNSNANTDTLYTGTNNPFFADAGTAYYYIDSVSLYDSLDYVTGLYDIKKTERFSLFPNPTVGNLTLSLFNISTSLNADIERKGQRDYLIKIHDVVGREVNALEYETEIDISNLEKGIYFLSVYKNKALIGTKKVVKE